MTAKNNHRTHRYPVLDAHNDSIILRQVRGDPMDFADVSDRYHVDLPRLRRGGIDAIECKINPDRFEPDALEVFRKLYPRGRNFVICPGVDESYERRVGKLLIRVTGCRELMRSL